MSIRQEYIQMIEQMTYDDFGELNNYVVSGGEVEIKGGFFKILEDLVSDGNEDGLFEEEEYELIRDKCQGSIYAFKHLYRYAEQNGYNHICQLIDSCSVDRCKLLLTNSDQYVNNEFRSLTGSFMEWVWKNNNPHEVREERIKRMWDGYFRAIFMVLELASDAAIQEDTQGRNSPLFFQSQQSITQEKQTFLGLLDTLYGLTHSLEEKNGNKEELEYRLQEIREKQQQSESRYYFWKNKLKTAAIVMAVITFLCALVATQLVLSEYHRQNKLTSDMVARSLGYWEPPLIITGIIIIVYFDIKNTTYDDQKRHASDANDLKNRISIAENQIQADVKNITDHGYNLYLPVDLFSSGAIQYIKNLLLSYGSMTIEQAYKMCRDEIQHQEEAARQEQLLMEQNQLIREQNRIIDENKRREGWDRAASTLIIASIIEKERKK